jgi:hypothetical protein
LEIGKKVHSISGLIFIDESIILMDTLMYLVIPEAIHKPEFLGACKTAMICLSEEIAECLINSVYVCIHVHVRA